MFAITDLIEPPPTTPPGYTERVAEYATKLDKDPAIGLRHNNPFNVFPGAGFTGEEDRGHRPAYFKDTQHAGVERPGYINGLRAGTRLLRNMWSGDVGPNVAVPDGDPRRTLRRIITHWAPPLRRQAHLDAEGAPRKVTGLDVLGFDKCRTPGACENNTAGYVESVTRYLAGLHDEGDLRYPQVARMLEVGDDMSIADVDLSDIVAGGLEDDRFLTDFSRAIVRHEQGAGFEDIFTDGEWAEAIRVAAINE